MSDKKPDLVVWSKEKGYYSKSLEYPTSLGSAVFEVPNVPLFREKSSKKMMDTFNQEKNEIVDQVKRLYEQYNDSIMVWESKFNFEPIVGKSYFLYNFGNKDTLSLISPEEWGKIESFVGEFKLNSENKWLRINERKISG